MLMCLLVSKALKFTRTGKNFRPVHLAGGRVQWTGWTGHHDRFKEPHFLLEGALLLVGNDTGRALSEK